MLKVLVAEVIAVEGEGVVLLVVVVETVVGCVG